jgi:hypothetical protein
LMLIFLSDFKILFNPVRFSIIESIFIESINSELTLAEDLVRFVNKFIVQVGTPYLGTVVLIFSF